MCTKLNTLLLLIYALVICSSSYGQDHFLTAGPAISYEHHVTGLLNAYSSSIDPVNAVSYGVDVAYARKRWLFDAKALTAKRTYFLTLYSPMAGYTPEIVKAKGQYYMIPVTASYRVLQTKRLHLFAGLGIATEWVPGPFETSQLNGPGTNPVTVPGANLGHSFSFGGGLQVVARYDVSQSLLIQGETNLRYYPEARTPFGFGNKREFGVSLTLAHIM